VCLQANSYVVTIFLKKIDFANPSIVLIPGPLLTHRTGEILSRTKGSMSRKESSFGNKAPQLTFRLKTTQLVRSRDRYGAEGFGTDPVPAVTGSPTF
jgi:hypothetical protein